MMRLGIVSDLHLEFRNAQEVQYLADMINEAGQYFDLLVNAGDIHPHPSMRAYFHSLLNVRHEYILGNHDFYGHQFITSGGFIVNRDPEKLHSVDKKIAMATLWTNFDNGHPLTMYHFPDTLADGRQIKKHDKYATLAEEMLDIFNGDLLFINNEQPDVVVTHHAPSGKSTAPQFKNSGFVNYYFHSDLDNFIINNPNIKLWVHGHMHNSSDYMIGNTRVVANPLGYPRETYRKLEDYKPLIVEV